MQVWVSPTYTPIDPRIFRREARESSIASCTACTTDGWRCCGIRLHRLVAVTAGELEQRLHRTVGRRTVVGRWGYEEKEPSNAVCGPERRSRYARCKLGRRSQEAFRLGQNLIDVPVHRHNADEPAQRVRIVAFALLRHRTSAIRPLRVGRLLADCRRCLRILERRLLIFRLAQAAVSVAEGQQASVPIQSLLMQINADAVCLVRTQFQQLITMALPTLGS